MPAHRPSFEEYFKSLAQEFQAVKNRLTSLIGHDLTIGENRESILRSVISRHLPESLLVGRGFVVTGNASSAQIDILILDASAPTLFREGDLFVVTPIAVRAAISVKTRVVGIAKWTETLTELSAVSELCRRHGIVGAWTGLFAFEGEDNQERNILKALRSTGTDLHREISCVCAGTNWFFRRWPAGKGLPGGGLGPAKTFWSSYELKDLAAAYFIGNMLQATAGNMAEGFAWFPLQGGKEVHLKNQMEAE